MHIRTALAHVHPCTKFGVPRSKGVRARGQKAEKIKLPPGGIILTPRGWFSKWHTIQTKALLTWKFGLPATSRLGCSPDNFFRRVHAAPRGTCHVAPRVHHHRGSVVSAHRMSRLPSGLAQPFRRYSRNLIMCNLHTTHLKVDCHLEKVMWKSRMLDIFRISEFLWCG